MLSVNVDQRRPSCSLPHVTPREERALIFGEDQRGSFLSPGQSSGELERVSSLEQLPFGRRFQPLPGTQHIPAETESRMPWLLRGSEPSQRQALRRFEAEMSAEPGDFPCLHEVESLVRKSSAQAPLSGWMNLDGTEGVPGVDEHEPVTRDKDRGLVIDLGDGDPQPQGETIGGRVEAEVAQDPHAFDSFKCSSAPTQRGAWSLLPGAHAKRPLPGTLEVLRGVKPPLGPSSSLFGGGGNLSPNSSCQRVTLCTRSSALRARRARFAAAATSP